MKQQSKDLFRSSSPALRGFYRVLALLTQRVNHGQALNITTSLVLTVLFLYLAFKKVSIEIMMGSLKEVRLLYLLPGMSLPLLSLFVRSFLWRKTFGKENKARLGALYRAILIGQMGNNLLPFRAGEFLRIYSIAQRERISSSLCLSTVIVERIFDFVSLAILAAVVAYSVDAGEFLRLGLIVISTGSVGVLSLLMWTANGPFVADLLLKCFNRVLSYPVQEKFRQILGQALLGLACLRSLRAVVSVFLLSLTCWGLMCLSYAFALKAYNVDFGWSIPLFLLVVLNVGMIIPTMPGSLGIYQFFSVWALGSFGVERSVALGLSFVLQAVDIVPVTLIGLWYFSKEGIYWSVWHRR